MSEHTFRAGDIITLHLSENVDKPFNFGHVVWVNTARDELGISWDGYDADGIATYMCYVIAEEVEQNRARHFRGPLSGKAGVDLRDAF